MEGQDQAAAPAPVVNLVTVEVQQCKESKEVFDAAIQIVKDIRAKKSITEIASDSLTKLITAVEGVDQLPAEVKDGHFYETAALGGAGLTKALLGKE